MSTRRFDDPITAVAQLRRQVRDLEAKALRRLGAHDHDGTYPLGTLGYAHVTATQSGITGEVNLSGLSVSVDVPAGRRIRITGRVQWSSDGTNDARTELRIYEGTTQLQNIRDHVHAASSGQLTTSEGAVIVTPSGGTHTYKLTGAASATTGSIDMGAASTVPAFILVEDIGPA